MRAVPPEVWASFEGRLDEARVPAPERPDYRKWVCFYLDFCHKYGHPAASPTSRGPFLNKLGSKNQSVAPRSQASAAVVQVSVLTIDTRTRPPELAKAFGETRSGPRG